MNLSFLTSFFQKPPKKLTNIETILIKKLKQVSSENTLYLYENIPIYNHSQKLLIPLLIVDVKRGIYLFEHKAWSFDELKNSTISKATKQDSSAKSLAFENTQDFMRLKFNEISHNDGAYIYNYLLMENLNQEQYHYLDDSYKTLLPFDKIIFNDTPKEEILKKLQQIPLSKKPYKLVDIISNLFVQYTILDNESKFMATEEQKSFIDLTIEGCVILSAKQGSGKTSAMLLKALSFALANPTKKIVIIKPTELDSDLLKSYLNKIIEYAMIEIDIDAIKILTPHEFSKIKKQTIHLLICDDVELLELDFIENLKQIQKTSALVLVTSKEGDSDLNFHKIFNNKVENRFESGKTILKTMEIISQIKQYKDIMIFSNNKTRENLFEELEVLLPKESALLYGSHNLINQNVDKLLLATYDDITTINKKHVLMLDVEHIPMNILEYVAKQAKDSTYVIYEEKSEKITALSSKLI